MKNKRIPFVLSEETRKVLDAYSRDFEQGLPALQELLQSEQGVIETVNWVREIETLIAGNRLQVKALQQLNTLYEGRTVKGVKQLGIFDRLRKEITYALDHYHNGQITIDEKNYLLAKYRPEWVEITDSDVIPAIMKQITVKITMPYFVYEAFNKLLEEIKRKLGDFPYVQSFFPEGEGLRVTLKNFFKKTNVDKLLTVKDGEVTVIKNLVGGILKIGGEIEGAIYHEDEESNRTTEYKYPKFEDLERLLAQAPPGFPKSGEAYDIVIRSTDGNEKFTIVKNTVFELDEGENGSFAQASPDGPVFYPLNSAVAWESRA
jgi:hypothetical protein